jgi:hypothetical protein
MNMLNDFIESGNAVTFIGRPMHRSEKLHPIRCFEAVDQPSNAVDPFRSATVFLSRQKRFRLVQCRVHNSNL